MPSKSKIKHKQGQQGLFLDIPKFSLKHLKDISKAFQNHFTEDPVADAFRFHTLLDTAKEKGYKFSSIVTPAMYCKVLVNLLKQGQSPGFLLISRICRESIEFCNEYMFELYDSLQFWSILRKNMLIMNDEFLFDLHITFAMVFLFVGPSDLEFPCTHQMYIDRNRYCPSVYTILPASLLVNILKQLNILEEEGISIKDQDVMLRFNESLCSCCSHDSLYINVDSMIIKPMHVAFLYYKRFLGDLDLLEHYIKDAEFMKLYMNFIRDHPAYQKLLMDYLTKAVEVSYKCDKAVFSTVTKQTDYVLMIKLATANDDKITRELVQKLIIRILILKEEKEIDASFFPSRKSLAAVRYSVLEKMIDSCQLFDRYFACIILGELTHIESNRDIIIRKGFPKHILSIIDIHDPNAASENEFLMLETALIVIQRLAHTNAKRQELLQFFNATHIVSRYIFHPFDMLSYNAKATCLNLTGRSWKTQYTLFLLVDFKKLTTDSHKYIEKYLQSQIVADVYYKRMHLNLALIKQHLTVNNHLEERKNNIIKNNSSMDKIDETTKDQLIFIMRNCLTDKNEVKTPTHSILSMFIFGYLMKNHKYLNLSKLLKTDVLKAILEISSDKTKTDIIDNEINFVDILKERYPLWVLPSGDVKLVDDKQLEKKNKERKCAWRACMNYETTDKTSKKILKKCAKCLSVYYCGTTCQKLDWSTHQKVCCKVKH